MRGVPERRGLPEPDGQADGGRLRWAEIDRRQLVAASGDPIAVVHVEVAVAPGLQRHAELAQLALVALEHAVERLVGAGAAIGRLVAWHRLADLLSGQVLAGREQAEHEIHQSLGTTRSHVLERSARVSERDRTPPSGASGTGWHGA